MGLPRSTFYDAPLIPIASSDVLIRIRAICDEFECYGYRRVGAALRHQGVVVNGKKAVYLAGYETFEDVTAEAALIDCRWPGRSTTGVCPFLPQVLPCTVSARNPDSSQK